MIAASKTAFTFYMLHNSKNFQLTGLTHQRKPYGSLTKTLPAASLSCTLCNIKHQLVSEAPPPVEMARKRLSFQKPDTFIVSSLKSQAKEYPKLYLCCGNGYHARMVQQVVLVFTKIWKRHNGSWIQYHILTKE